MLRKAIEKLLEGVDLDKEKKNFDELMQQVKQGINTTGKQISEEIDNYLTESKFSAEMLLLGKAKEKVEAKHPGLQVTICFEKLGVKAQSGHIEYTFNQSKGMMTFAGLKEARRTVTSISDSL